ncbi:MAG: hypothetical protein K1Y36_28960 [Blastocatellia bacterium]|nr:hypothetical protein [Blastocatellia bacterium]
MNRKMTAWRKNRNLGDISGGRCWVKIEDRVLHRVHSLKPPVAGAELPIVLEDNPSRDFFFPVTGLEVSDCFKQFPKADTDGITHLWLRRRPGRVLQAPDHVLAEYLRGSGVCAIVLYPWARDMLLRFGPTRPSHRVRRAYQPWTTDWFFQNGIWFLHWTEPALKDFYLRVLLGHEIGHHCDPNRWSRANGRKCEQTADQYALAQIKHKEARSPGKT